MSLIDRQFELQSIERKVIPIPTPMQSMTSPTFLMAVAAVAMSVIAIFTVACVVKGRQCQRDPQSAIARSLPRNKSYRFWKRRKGEQAGDTDSAAGLHEPSIGYSVGAGTTGGGTIIIMPVAPLTGQTVASAAAGITSPAVAAVVPPQAPPAATAYAAVAAPDASRLLEPISA